MTLDDFILTWSGNPLSERTSAHPHFRDLCALLGIGPPSPLTAGTFELEKGTAKTTGGQGWADVWLKDAVAWNAQEKGPDQPGSALLLHSSPRLLKPGRSTPGGVGRMPVLRIPATLSNDII